MGQKQSYSNSNLAQTFDLNKYIGTWYEIARFPLIWESNCVNAIAKYTLDEIGDAIKVENTCIMKDGTSYSRTGIAFLSKGAQKNHLKLTFNDGLPSNGLSNYWILDTDYTGYALVGNKERSHVWILSRQPMMSYCVYSALLILLRDVHHYDIAKLIRHTNVITSCLDNKHN